MYLNTLFNELFMYFLAYLICFNISCNSLTRCLKVNNKMFGHTLKQKKKCNQECYSYYKKGTIRQGQTADLQSIFVPRVKFLLN